MHGTQETAVMYMAAMGTALMTLLYKVGSAANSRHIMHYPSVMQQGKYLYRENNRRQ